MKIISVTLSILLLSLSCSFYQKTMKPCPDPETYELCPSCKGYGSIKSSTGETPPKGVEGLNEINEALEPFAKKTAEEESELYRPGERVEKSYIIKQVTCPRCKGIGWLDKKQSSESQMDDKQVQEGFDKVNKLIDK